MHKRAHTLKRKDIETMTTINYIALSDITSDGKHFAVVRTPAGVPVAQFRNRKGLPFFTLIRGVASPQDAAWEGVIGGISVSRIAKATGAKRSEVATMKELWGRVQMNLEFIKSEGSLRDALAIYSSRAVAA
jgi:hypothetical protein